MHLSTFVDFFERGEKRTLISGCSPALPNNISIMFLTSDVAILYNLDLQFRRYASLVRLSSHVAKANALNLILTDMDITS